MKERDNIIRILKETKLAVTSADAVKIKQLSNQTIHTASIAQDPDNIAVAVIVYTLGKIVERENYQTYKGWKTFFNHFLRHIEIATQSLEQNKLEEFRKQITQIRKEIESLHGNFKKHVQDVFERARISKASRIYEHGVSMEQTANLLGITLWELADYAGQTGIGDVQESITDSEKNRIKLVQDFFK